MMFSKETLELDAAAEVQRITGWISETVFRTLRRKGGVVGVSGGIDSSVTYALTVKALGPERVIAVSMPETDSEPESEHLARELMGTFGGSYVVEPITPALEGFRVYRRRNDAVRKVFPEFADHWKMKITLPGDVKGSDRFNFFQLTVIDPDGGEHARRLPLDSYLEIVAASNIKQRSRMITLYHAAEAHNYAVVGTPNINEDSQGFFVKYGDGGVDLRPIAHLYKTQVYQLGRELQVPDSILGRVPTTDTYSAPVTQEEFYFRLPFEEMDLLLYAWHQDIPLPEVCAVMELTEEQVQRIYRDFAQKAKMAQYLSCAPLMMTPPGS
jgi:NAD+ synthase